MTKREMFELIATLNSDNEEVVDFCKHEIELLANRKTSKSPTKTQKANEVLMERIAEVLVNYPDGVTVTNLIRENDEFAEYSGQKMSALLKKMVDAGTVNKVIDKRTTLFVLA